MASSASASAAATLAGGPGTGAAARLADGPSTGTAARLARERARAILAESRFHSGPIPRPLHGLLHAIGKALESPLEELEELVSSLAVGVPGGTATAWAALAAAVLALSALLAARGARRSLRDPTGDSARAGAARALRASDLERDATAAEAQGRHADAVRLGFRAGLMRLAERQLVDGAPSMLNADVSRALRSEHFDRLASRFEEIAYGGRQASAEDVRRARREWGSVLGSGDGA
jgi:uncharacterized protein DUF4129